VATFDHGTGRAARAAVRVVAARCATLGVQVEIGRATGLAHSESAWRSARWAFLITAAGSDRAIVTAHIRDDQVETVLLRILRGAGARGLAGMMVGSVVRPLLGVSRTDIREYARERRLRWVDDPSNAAPAHLRNRVRMDLLPALRSVTPSIEDALLELGLAGAEWRRDVAAAVDGLEYRVVRARDAEKAADAEKAPNAGEVADADASAVLEVSTAALATLSPEALDVAWPELAARAGCVLDRRGIARLTEFTHRGRVGAAIELSGGWTVTRSRARWTLRRGPLKGDGPEQAAVSPRSGTTWDGWQLRPATAWDPADPWTAWLPLDELLSIRAWRAGDRLTPEGRSTTRTVKQLLSRAGVTGEARRRWPVIHTNESVIWVPGVRRAVGATEQPGRAGLPYRCDPRDA
jgi:tRNA(Ile)-lysidine synthase